VIVVIFVLLAVVLVLVNVPAMTDCRGTPAESNKQWFRAVRIVVQPWRGPHHVYGIFNVPLLYKYDRLYTAKLVIQGFPLESSEASPEGGVIANGQAEPEHYIKRMYLPTRTALWFLLTGRFGDLRTACHWWVVIADRK